MRRREFIALTGAAAAVWPLAARAQQAALPVIGYLHLGDAGSFAHVVAAFKLGLKEGGFVDRQNVAIEYRFANGQDDRLPAMAADLVRLGVTVIATSGAEHPALAAKAATKTIPIVFLMGGDPVKRGVVPSLARPAGNVTGINMFSSALESKRFNLLHQAVPAARTIAGMVNPNRGSTSESQKAELREAAMRFGVRLLVVEVHGDSEFEPAFAHLTKEGAGALQVCGAPYFFSRRQHLVALAARYRVPTIYESRQFVDAGGLMSYGTDLADAYRLEGGYVAKILKGAKPADLPVMQSTKFEFVINLKTAKVLSLEISPMLTALADDVIK
jgi:putative ABC transport system substrate-binding protein